MIVVWIVAAFLVGACFGFLAGASHEHRRAELARLP